MSKKTTKSIDIGIISMSKIIIDHELKIAPHWYSKVCYNRKLFEIRLKDRDYQVNQIILLREWEKEYTGREHRVIIKEIKDINLIQANILCEKDIQDYYSLNPL